MFKKQNLGILLFIILTIIPVIIWIIYIPLAGRLSDYGEITHSLGQLTGLVGMTLFALTFILSTRLKILEKYFGSMDKVYALHAVIGGTAFILLLSHPIFLVLKFIPDNVTQAMVYLLPSSSLSVNLGIVALLLMIGLIATTLYIQIKYSYWKLSHKFLGLTFIIAIFHIFLVTTDISRSVLLRNYMILICAIGVSSFSYTTFIKRFTSEKYSYTVSSIEHKSNNTITINLKPNERSIEFIPGQFIFIRFFQQGISNEQHPFSVASSPKKHEIRLVIKYLGDFTKDLKNLKAGTLAKIEGPFGRFNYNNYSDKSQVWIAGGVGITPYLSMAENIEINGKLENNITLYYCFKSHEDSIYLEKFEDISNKIKNFDFIAFCSDEKGFLDADHILKDPDDKDKIFFLCGPPPMMNSLKRQLINKGIPVKNIIMEDFSFK